MMMMRWVTLPFCSTLCSFNDNISDSISLSFLLGYVLVLHLILLSKFIVFAKSTH